MKQFFWLHACSAFGLLIGGGACTGTIEQMLEPEWTADDEGQGAPVKPDLMIAKGEEFACVDPSVVDPGPTLARRLTRDEYVATVRQVLGVDIENDARALLPLDGRADGFRNTATALVVLLEHVQAYEQLAAMIATRLGDGAVFVRRWSDCESFGEGCESALVEALGLALFRAPVETSELDSFLELFAAVQEEDATFGEAALLVTEAMLQSPRFLYRMETQIGDGSAERISAINLASRISYFVVGASPDEGLLEAARTGGLDDEAEVRAQVERLLADPRARLVARRYVADWLNLGRLEHVIRSDDHFADWDPALGADMREETLRLFEHIAFDEPQSLSRLLDASSGFISEPLAAHYGIDGTPRADGSYDLSGRPERGGLLTHGSILTLGGDEGSMVGRGLFVLRNLLCGGIADPPPGADTTPKDPEAGRSQRFYAEERVANPSCGGCHSQMEPLAFGIERFDSVGRYQSEDSHGNPLREDGSVVFPDQPQAVSYKTVGELSKLLADQGRAGDCMTLKATQFAMGRPLVKTDACSLSAIRDTMQDGDGTYADMVAAIVLSPMFRHIRTERAQ